MEYTKKDFLKMSEEELLAFYLHMKMDSMFQRDIIPPKIHKIIKDFKVFHEKEKPLLIDTLAEARIQKCQTCNGKGWVPPYPELSCPKCQ